MLCNNSTKSNSLALISTKPINSSFLLHKRQVIMLMVALFHQSQFTVLPSPTESAYYTVSQKTPSRLFVLTSANFDCFLLRDTRSAKRGIAIVSRPSVCPSLTLIYVGWTSSKLITRIISLGSSLLGQHRQSSPRGTPSKFGGIGVGSLFSAENLQYL